MPIFTCRVQAAIVVVVILGLWGIVFYRYIEGMEYGFQAEGRRIATLSVICRPLEKKFDIRQHKITCFRDGSMEIDITVNDPGQAFDIVREIDTLRKNDPDYLSKAPIHVHIQSAGSGPDGVDFRVELPGDPGCDCERDRDSTGKTEETIRRFEGERHSGETRRKHPGSDDASGGGELP